MIAANRNRVPIGNFARAKRERISDQTERWRRRKDVCAARDVFFQDVVLDRAADLVERYALLTCDREIETQKNGGSRIDGHRRGNVSERNTFKKPQHVFQRINCHSNPSDLASGQWIV